MQPKVQADLQFLGCAPKLTLGCSQDLSDRLMKLFKVRASMILRCFWSASFAAAQALLVLLLLSIVLLSIYLHSGWLQNVHSQARSRRLASVLDLLVLVTILRI